MKGSLEEAWSALKKAKEEMTRFYNLCQDPTPVFKPGNKVFKKAPALVARFYCDHLSAARVIVGLWIEGMRFWREEEVIRCLVPSTSGHCALGGG